MSLLMKGERLQWRQQQQEPRSDVVHQFQLMTLGMFQAVKFGGSKGGPGVSVAIWGGSGWWELEDGSGKEVEPEASEAERAGNINHAAITVNHSKARHTRQVVDTGPALTNFVSIAYWRNCTFITAICCLTSN